MPLTIAFNAIPAGSYDGRVTDIRFHHSGIDAVILTYTVEHNGTEYSLSEYLPFDAPPMHPRYNDTAKGKSRVIALLGPNPTISDQDDLTRQLLGIEVRVGVGTRMQDGLAVPKVVTVSRANPLAAELQED